MFGIGRLGTLGCNGNPFSWVLAGANIDMDFANGRYYGRNPSGLTTTRNSIAYASNTAGIWSSFAVNTPRITNNGLLVEEARTNSIPNNTMTGAAVGTPGTLPDGWATSYPVHNLTSNITSVTTTQGISTITFAVSGTSNATAVARLAAFCAAGIGPIVTTDGVVWTLSVFLSATNITNLSAVNLRFDYYDVGGSLLSTEVSDIKASLTTSLQRLSFTITTPASTIYIRPSLELGYSSGAVISTSIMVGWPQAEVGADATSPIATTSAAVTRAADIVTLASPPTFATSYSLFGQGVPNSVATSANPQFIVTVSDGTANNRFIILRNSTTAPAYAVNTSGGSATNISLAAWSQFASGKLVAATAGSDQAASFNGAAVGTGAGSLPVGVNAVKIGSNQAGSGGFWNGYIARIAIWPSTRLSNAQLQAITS